MHCPQWSHSRPSLVVATCGQEDLRQKRKSEVLVINTCRPMSRLELQHSARPEFAATISGSAIPTSTPSGGSTAITTGSGASPPPEIVTTQTTLGLVTDTSFNVANTAAAITKEVGELLTRVPHCQVSLWHRHSDHQDPRCKFLGRTPWLRLIVSRKSPPT